MKVVLNYGMGVDSTVILHRWLTDATSRDFDLADLLVVTAQTGDEFPDTKRLVETHILPLMRDRRVRYVQLARKGPKVEDGVAILADTRMADFLFIGGDYKLSDELTSAGTVPQVAHHKCAMKFKGWVIDSWLQQEMEGNPFRQAMGFNADEVKRIERDACYGTNGRQAEYPLMQWGMGRQACEDYLLGAFGEPWRKSCCSFCPFAAGKPDVMDRYRDMPSQAADALLIEHMSLALNPNMTLYSSKSLRSCLEKDGNFEALADLHDRLNKLPWVVYRVRRVYKAKGVADRAVSVFLRGRKDDVVETLFDIAEENGADVEHTAGSHRVYLRRREPNVYPTVEEMYVAAPALVNDKARPNFERTWENALLQLAY